jgi:hypothetical protein
MRGAKTMRKIYYRLIIISGVNADIPRQNSENITKLTRDFDGDNPIYARD